MARDFRRTIESLERLAERPGTPEEGETARRLLEKMRGNRPPPPKPYEFDPSEWPQHTRIYYNRWAYDLNDPGVIVGRYPKIIQGQVWLRIKFDRLASARRVPVTSNDKGCHISKEPLTNARGVWLSGQEWMADND